MALHEVKLCLLGDSGVGKSSIVHRFVYDAFRPAMEATIGAAFLTKTVVVDGDTYKYQIWDTAGQEKYRALAPMYYRGAAAAIVVFDITRDASFQAMRSWISELQKHASPNIVLAIAGNKADLDDMREVQYSDAQQYAESQGAVFVETSAKTAVNIAALFMEISKKFASIDDFSLSNSRGDTVNVGRQRRGNAQSQGKKPCCGNS